MPDLLAIALHNHVSTTRPAGCFTPGASNTRSCVWSQAASPYRKGLALGYVIKILALCFAVGFVLTTFDIRPAEILTNSWQTIVGIYEVLLHFVEWAVPYILVGAVVVIPLLILSTVMRRARRLDRSRDPGHRENHPGGHHH